MSIFVVVLQETFLLLQCISIALMAKEEKWVWWQEFLADLLQFHLVESIGRYIRANSSAQ